MLAFAAKYPCKLKFCCFFSIANFSIWISLCFSCCKNASIFFFMSLLNLTMSCKYGWKKGSDTIPPAKVVPLIVYLSEFWLFYLLKNHFVIFYGKSVFFLLFRGDLAKSFNLLYWIYLFCIFLHRISFELFCIECHAECTLPKAFMFFIYVSLLKLSKYSFRLTAMITMQGSSMFSILK